MGKSPLPPGAGGRSPWGAGAEKYLDELLIWRELAWAFCYHEPHHETLAAIPAWARETLAERPPPTPESLKSYEALRSAKSGEPLWGQRAAGPITPGDATQQSAHELGQADTALEP